LICRNPNTWGKASHKALGAANSQPNQTPRPQDAVKDSIFTLYHKDSKTEGSLQNIGFLRALESSSLCVAPMYPCSLPGANLFTSSKTPGRQEFNQESWRLGGKTVLSKKKRICRVHSAEQSGGSEVSKGRPAKSDYWIAGLCLAWIRVEKMKLKLPKHPCRRAGGCTNG